MRSLFVRCLFGNMKIEKLGETAKIFGLLGSNTKTITSPKPHLFEESVFSTGAAADAAPSQQRPKIPLVPLFETAVLLPQKPEAHCRRKFATVDGGLVVKLP